MSDNNALLLPKAVLRATLFDEVVKCFNEALFTDMTSKDETQPHYNKCTKCQQNLDQIVYQCWNCSQVWLCTTCEEKEFQTHPASHIFLKKKIEQCDKTSEIKLEEETNHVVGSNTVENGDLFESTLDSMPTVTTDLIIDDDGLEDLVELAKWASEEIQSPPKPASGGSELQVDDGVNFNGLLDEPNDPDVVSFPAALEHLDPIPAPMLVPGRSTVTEKSDDVPMFQIDSKFDDGDFLDAAHNSTVIKIETELICADGKPEATVAHNSETEPFNADSRFEAELVDADSRSEAGLVDADSRSESLLNSINSQEWDVITSEQGEYSSGNVNIEWCSDSETQTSFSIVDPNERMGDLSDTSDDEDYEKCKDFEKQLKSYIRTIADSSHTNQFSNATPNVTPEPSLSVRDSPTNHTPVRPSGAPLVVDLPDVRPKQAASVLTGCNQPQTSPDNPTCVETSTHQSPDKPTYSTQSTTSYSCSDQSQSRPKGSSQSVGSYSRVSSQSQSRQTDTLEDIAEMTIQAVQSAGSAMVNKWYRFIQDLDEYVPASSEYDDSISREQTTPHTNKQPATNIVGLSCLSSGYVPPQTTYVPKTRDWKPSSDDYKPRTTFIHRDMLDKHWTPKPYQPRSTNYNYGMKAQV